MDFNQNLAVFKEGLGIMVFGMAGIFIVLMMIFASVKILLKVFPVK